MAGQFDPGEDPLTVDSTAISSAKSEEIGVLLVHGIGQQTPYIHLHTECRSILAAMSDTARSIHVERSPNAVPATAKWSPTDVLVASLVNAGGKRQEIHFHETF